MKIQSKTEVQVCHDREGVLSGKIQVEIFVDRKDAVNKRYEIREVDSIVLENDAVSVLKNRYGQPSEKTYTKTYEEFDAVIKAMRLKYPSELLGSDLEDYLLKMSLFDGIDLYGVEFEIVE